jgi:hypothetical protein
MYYVAASQGTWQDNSAAVQAHIRLWQRLLGHANLPLRCNHEGNSQDDGVVFLLIGPKA